MKISRVLSTAIILASLAAPALAAGSGGSQPATAVQQTQIKAAFMNQCKLLMAGDFDGFSKTMTASFTDTDPNGKKQNRDESVTDAKQAMTQDGIKLTGCDISIKSSGVDGSGNVTVTALTTQDGTVTAPTGQAAPLHIDATETDTWTNQGGTWVESASTTTESIVKMNGIVVQHLGGSTPNP